FVILDKARDLGGTWRDNQYPGCACDVPSPLYSYSFELNPDWSHLFAPQQEIWDYLRNCARKYRLDEHIIYGCAVERMDWDAAAPTWRSRARCGPRFGGSRGPPGPSATSSTWPWRPGRWASPSIRS